MKFNLISRLVLALLIFSGVGKLALARTILPAKTAQITLEGALPPNCSVKIGGDKEHTLSMATKDGKVSPSISVASHCNRTSTHTLEFSYDHTHEGKGALWHKELQDKAAPITYEIKTTGGKILTPQAPLESTGREINERIQVHFDTDNKSAGTYEGNVILTVTDA